MTQSKKIVSFKKQYIMHIACVQWETAVWDNTEK